MLYVYQNNVIDSVIAESPEDATAVWLEMNGEDEYTADDYGEWVAEPDDKVLTIHDDDEGAKVSKTCAEWASEGRGFLGSTEY